VLAEETEKRVVERAKNGDRTAIKQIYDCYARYLAATCSRFLPDPTDQRDVLQDSFVKIFTSLDKFDFKGEGSLKAWMRQVTVNEALKLLRKRKRSPFVKLELDVPDEDIGPEEEPDVGDVPRQVIQDFVKDLPEGYRTVLNLYVFEEKSHREISRLLGISESTSASQLHRARAILARKIKEFKEKTNIKQ
jgi:RNA polymerase sigma-70 factor (ECF subfamily)